MKIKVLILALVLSCFAPLPDKTVVLADTPSQAAPEIKEVFSAAYGNPSNPAIIFIHGGPGQNSVMFEYSTAQALADQGFYVIVYDQRGSGRSKGLKNPAYTFAEAINDLNRLYDKYKIKQAYLLGHSWGGTIATEFAAESPEKVSSLVLVSAPLVYQETFKAIIENCTKNYTAANPEGLKYLDFVRKMDHNSLNYSTASFYHAMQCGLYSVKDPLDSAKAMFKKLAGIKEAKYLFDFTTEPVSGFYEHEKYTTLNLTGILNKIKSKVPIYGIYGTEDGLFEPRQLAEIEAVTGKDHFMVVEHASHGVFIDNQEVFLQTLIKYLKK
jgi:proline iminopeptidase